MLLKKIFRSLYDLFNTLLKQPSLPEELQYKIIFNEGGIQFMHFAPNEKKARRIARRLGGGPFTRVTILPPT